MGITEDVSINSGDRLPSLYSVDSVLVQKEIKFLLQKKSLFLVMNWLFNFCCRHNSSQLYNLE